MNNIYYTFTVASFTHALESLIGILKKAKQFAEEKKVSDDAILSARIAVDMFPFVRQVQMVSDNAKGNAARFAGVEIPKMEDNEKTLDELIVRLEKTKEFLGTLKPEQFADAATREIRLSYFPGKHFIGSEYLLEYVIPNFYFHLTTAYDILRGLGMTIGKADFLGKISIHDDTLSV